MNGVRLLLLTPLLLSILPSISSALFEAGRKYGLGLGLGGYMIADDSKLSRIAAQSFNEL